jgi:hypothetical protein
VPQPTPPSPPVAAPGSLSVTSLTATAWHANGEFHYRPVIQVTAGRDGSAVSVSSLRFEAAGDDGALKWASLRYPNGRRVLPGATVDLSPSSFEIITGFRAHTLRAILEFTDDTSRAGSVVAESPAPIVPIDATDTSLAIQRFVVIGSVSGGLNWYWPQLTLTETTGRGPVRIVNMVFELLDIGPAGRVPSVPVPISIIPAGGTIVLDEDPLGYGPWMEISNSVKASRVSVVIYYIDAEGRGGSVTAIANVS